MARTPERGRGKNGSLLRIVVLRETKVKKAPSFDPLSYTCLFNSQREQVSQPIHFKPSVPQCCNLTLVPHRILTLDVEANQPSQTETEADR